MSKVVTAVSRMPIHCPPEVLLRTSIRSTRSVVSPCPSGSRSQSHLAAVCSELGKPLQVKDVPTPQSLKKGQVLLKVGAAGINYADVLMCAGLYQEKPPLPFVPGSEVAGQVTAVGEGVNNVAVNDRVFGLSQLSGMSQYCVTDNRMLWKLPDIASFSQSASLLISYGTAYMALQRTAQVKQGETILVTAAAGALGLAAVDLGAHVFGCKVLGACGGPEKGELVKQKGADFVIDYTKDSVRERVKELTNGKGADVVIDPVGGSIFMECVRSIAFEGRLITLGYASGDIPKIPANHLLVKSCSVRGLYWGSYAQRNPQIFQENVASILRLFQEGKITPHVSKSFSLQQVNEAFQFLQSRKSTGKVVLEIQ